MIELIVFCIFYLLMGILTTLSVLLLFLEESNPDDIDNVKYYLFRNYDVEEYIPCILSGLAWPIYWPCRLTYKLIRFILLKLSPLFYKIIAKKLKFDE